MVNAQEIKNMTIVRSWFYDFCSRAILEQPNKVAWKELIEQNLFTQMMDLDRHQDGVVELSNTLKEMDSYSDDDWKKLQQSYGIIPEITVHTNYDLEEAIKKMNLTYGRWGLPQKEQPFLFGEVGQGLKFMNFLVCTTFEYIQQEQWDKVKELLAEQEDFLVKHLKAIAQPMSERLSQEHCSSFYLGLAEFLPSYLEMEVEVLQKEIEALSH